MEAHKLRRDLADRPLTVGAEVEPEQDYWITSGRVSVEADWVVQEIGAHGAYLDPKERIRRIDGVSKNSTAYKLIKQLGLKLSPVATGKEDASSVAKILEKDLH